MNGCTGIKQLAEEEALKGEYIELRLAEELDDVDSSLSTLVYRDKRIGEIEKLASPEEIGKWNREIERHLKRYPYFASGAPHLTIKDYIYCEDCKIFVDFWKYDHDIKAASHEDCNWRYVTEEELMNCLKDCIEAGCFEEEML